MAVSGPPQHHCQAADLDESRCSNPKCSKHCRRTAGIRPTAAALLVINSTTGTDPKRSLRILSIALRRIGIVRRFSAVLLFLAFSNLNASNVRCTECEIGELVCIILKFEATTGTLPESIDELIEQEYLPQAPIDFWRHPFNYSLSKPEIATKDLRFYVWSYGLDGEPGGDWQTPEYDWGNWNAKNLYAHCCDLAPAERMPSNGRESTK